MGGEIYGGFPLYCCCCRCTLVFGRWGSTYPYGCVGGTGAAFLDGPADPGTTGKGLDRGAGAGALRDWAAPGLGLLYAAEEF